MLSGEQTGTRFPVKVALSARFADVDSHGHVNNAKYFTYMEEGNLAYFAHVPELTAVETKSFESGIVVATTSCDFLGAIKTGDQLVVAVGVTKIGKKSLSLEYQISRKSTGELLAKGATTFVMFDFVKKTAIEIPETARLRIQELEGAVPANSVAS